MSKKYVIEIKPEYEDTTKGVMVLGARESNLYVDTLSIEDLEELNSDYINEHFGELQDEAYQRGLEDGKWKAEDGCDGCKYYEDTSLTNPCSECTRAWKDHYTPAPHSDRIEVGDIVERYVDGKLDSKGIYLQEDGGYWRCLFYTGAIFMTFAYPKGQFKKTGKHYDIASILEAMRNDR
jgi:hypothetical protein